MEELTRKIINAQVETTLTDGTTTTATGADVWRELAERFIYKARGGRDIKRTQILENYNGTITIKMTLSNGVKLRYTVER